MEEFVIWEAPPIIKPEFRLYYDERGNVLFYTCEKPAGNYVIIDVDKTDFYYKFLYSSKR